MSVAGEVLFAVMRFPQGTDRARAVEYIETPDGKRLAEVSLALPEVARQEFWREFWKRICDADVANWKAKTVFGEPTSE